MNAHPLVQPNPHATLAIVTPYNAAQIAWELERTALGDGFYGNALRVAKDIPGVTDGERALLDRYATGLQAGADHIALQTLALRLDKAGCRMNPRALPKQLTADLLTDMARLCELDRIVAVLDDLRTYIEIHGAALWWDDGTDSGEPGWTVALYDKNAPRHAVILSEKKYGTFADALTAATKPD